MKIRYGVLIVVMSLLYGCGATDTLTISVINPPTVYIPKNIKSVGIINRSTPSNDNKIYDDLDKVLSIEGKHLDEKGAARMVAGLSDELIRVHQFSEVKILEDVELDNPGMDVFPVSIPWGTVEEICRENDIEILFSLAFYDTDSEVKYDVDAVKVDVVPGLSIPAYEHRATVTTYIKAGWRIYNPVEKLVLDEYTSFKTVTLKGKGINPLNAYKTIIGREKAVLDQTGFMGREYISRINPYKIRVRRKYYVKGSSNFKTAERRAHTGNWNGAAKLWELELSSSKSKIAGRACYNMAIVCEINGDLEAAKIWASKAYEDYKDKNALSYVRVLSKRIAKNALIESQL